MVRGFTCSKTDHAMKEIGSKVNEMAGVFISMQMEVDTLESIRQGSEMGFGSGAGVTAEKHNLQGFGAAREPHHEQHLQKHNTSQVLSTFT